MTCDRSSIQRRPIFHPNFTVTTDLLIRMDLYVSLQQQTWTLSSNVLRPSHQLRRQALQKIALLSTSNDSSAEVEQSDFARLCHACPRSRSGLNGSARGPRYTPSDIAKSPMVYLTGPPGDAITPLTSASLSQSLMVCYPFAKLGTELTTLIPLLGSSTKYRLT